MICLKCGYEQFSGVECLVCGVIIEKYLVCQVQFGENVVFVVIVVVGVFFYILFSVQVGDVFFEFGELNVFIINGWIGCLCYFGWLMVMMLCFLVIMGLGFLFGEIVGVVVIVLVLIVFIVIVVMIGVQCLYDFGWLGWFWLFNFVFFVGSVFGILMLVLFGSIGVNCYGLLLLVNSIGVKVLVSLIILLLIVGIIVVIVLLFYQGYLE